MPCVVCGRLLAVREWNSDDLQRHLFCPQCEDLNIELQTVIRAKTQYLVNDSKYSAERIPYGLGEYKKEQVLAFLINRLNEHLHRFFRKNGLYTYELGYLASLIYSVFQAQGFGNKSISDFEEFGEKATTMRDGFAVIHRAFLDAHEEFSICEKELNFSGEFDRFADDYVLHPSEYLLAFDRIFTALVCGDPANWDTYVTVTEKVRDFRRIRETDNPRTVEEYADFWYEIINQLKVVASMDPIINEVYFTDGLPDELTIFHIEDMLDQLDNSLTPIQEEKVLEGQCVALDEEVVEQSGRKAFGEYWEEVRPWIIVGENSLDAHPFLFELSYTKEYNLANRDGTASVPKTEYIYPRDYARLVKYQLFPLLQNKGTADSGHKILKRLTDKRSNKYEENFYEFLEPRSTSCYLRPEITDSDGSELDLICVFNEEVHFVELKFLMPPAKLRSRDGVTTVNQKFDLPIFNEEVEDVPRTASGPTLPKKIDQWLALDPGQVFKADRSSGPREGKDQRIGEDWWGKKYKKFVVSNLTPSYVQKQGVRFLTDFEYVKLVEEGDDSVLYPIWDGRQEPNRKQS